MNSTFNGCTSLVKAPSIPSSVMNMNNAFNGCTSLTGTITINSSNIGFDSEEDEEEESTLYEIFTDVANPLTVRVPVNSLTYTTIVASYGSSSNITIQTFEPES